MPKPAACCWAWGANRPPGEADVGALPQSEEVPDQSAAPVNLADRPDFQCIDVRGLSSEEGARLESNFIAEND